ncbi:MFS transporter [Actinoplanes friuliensis]|uniref:Major facilitator superfamily protein n=1 Tax=Actinoplanes friuliensis DSM 7358 TaxID=1246995 RepID=U5VZ71_9ACTN|nr:MFS transporter [Actinoplanes friuliensis]AGZ42283.1 major facilitator superfamily protein [Actinoplanes friuliensis DSM 7358]
MTFLLALACGIAVGNVYFPQADSPSIAAGLHVDPAAAAAVVTAVQAGYTAGLFLIVPLGDRFRHRPLIVTLFALTGTALLAASLMPALLPLVAASVVVGVCTVAAPVIGPMAAGLVPPGRQGVTSGILLSGSTAGMLLSRTFSGYLGEWFGWRVPYLGAGLLALLMAVLLARTLPATRQPVVRLRYPALLAEPLRLLRTEPELRRSCVFQATVFAGFSAVWTSVALLLTGPAYGLDARAVGLLALVNAATMLCTPVAGRLVDRHGSNAVNLVCLGGVIVAAVVLAVPGLGFLIAGTLLLDVFMQCGMVANQVRIFRLPAEIRSRLNTAYMTCAYTGGAAGSWLGLRAYAHFGWLGVCTLVAVLAGLALTRARFATGRRTSRPRRPARRGFPAPPGDPRP